VTSYVYGIARAAHPSLPEGMDGIGDPPRAVRVLVEGDLAAVVSDAPEGLRPKRRDLLAHQNVLAEIGAGGPVLPMRFGSLSSGDETVRAALAENGERYLRRLGELEGKVEYNVKAAHDEEAVIHQVLSEEPEIRALSDVNRAAEGGSYEDRLRLGEMVANAVRVREERDAQLVRKELSPLAQAVSPGPEGTGWLANISLLVDRDSADAFLTRVGELEKAYPQLELRVHGPLPPYSFVEPVTDSMEAA
jgi:hypothetical protein